MKIMILPGNGGCQIHKHHWYKWLSQTLEHHGFDVIAQDMPDPILARKEIWLPFIEQKIGDDPEAILIGHSSGAQAAMRYGETHSLTGMILVSACYSDLGSETEKLSGYYSNPWNWEAIRNHCKWIAQLASSNDPFIPLKEAHFVRDHLQPHYLEFSDRGHFMGSEKGGDRLQEAVDIILAHTK